MNAFSQLVIIAVLVEAIWENVKRVYSDSKVDTSVIGSLAVSIVVCSSFLRFGSNWYCYSSWSKLRE